MIIAMIRLKPIFLSLVIVLVGLSSVNNIALGKPIDDEGLAAILDQHWADANEEQIFFRKDPDAFRMNGALPDMSEEGRSRRQAFNQSMLDSLAKIDKEELSARDQVTFALFHYEREAEAASYQQLDHLYPLHYYSSWFSYYAGAPNNMSFLSKQDYDNYLVSLADFPRYNQQFLQNLEQAVAAGHVHYCDSVEGYDARISKHVVAEPESSIFFVPIANMPASINDEDRDRIRAKASELIMKAVVPEYQKSYKFMTERYLPNCRKEVGVTKLEGGEDYYQYLIKFYTTTDYSADEIYELGLSEVARIRTEMESLIEQTGFKGSFKEFIYYLRNDSRFYTDEAEDLLEKASYIARKMAAQLPKWFGLLPRNTFDIKESPEGGAYYVGADGTGLTSGTYYVDTKDLTAQPLYNLEALTFHEAEPGHHFQGSIAQELDVAEFRKTLYHSAFGEGWGLYSEALGKEMGFYQDPYSDFGRLTYEMWRACRLVVDNGIHAKGWSRQKAIDYLADNTALSMPDVIAQIDRYVTWPAQALSYKIGELKIREMRAKAEKTLGDDFNIRDFHDQMLKNGSLPLELLEELFESWLKEQLSKK
jgi:uncharacterized protein (DUF885 family)